MPAEESVGILITKYLLSVHKLGVYPIFNGVIHRFYTAINPLIS